MKNLNFLLKIEIIQHYSLIISKLTLFRATFLRIFTLFGGTFVDIAAFYCWILYP